MKRYLSLCLAALLVLALMPTMALATTEVEVDTAEELADAIQKATSGATIKLTDNIEVNASNTANTANNTAIYAITVDNVTINGGNHTITVTNERMKGEYTGPILFGFNGAGATGGTIKNLNIKVTNEGVKHAIQAYKGAELTVENVEVSGCLGYALVVNGSKVTVKGDRGLVTNGSNGSGGINVDLGDGVKTSANLTIMNAEIEEENSVYVEHNNSKTTLVTATIEDGIFKSVGIAEGETVNTTLKVSGGTFTTPPTEYASSKMTVYTVNDTTYVKTEEGITQVIGKLEEGCIITVLKGNLNLSKLPAGATVTNKGDGQVTVGSNLVGPGESYPPQPTKPTEPTKPIAGVVIGGGNQQEDEDEPEQSPSNTLRYAVICRTLNVRFGPGTEYSKLGTLSRGTLLDGELLSNGWVKFSYNGQTAYVSGMYVQSVDNGQLSVQCGTLNVRSGAGTSYSKIGALYRGTYVKPLETQGNWYKIGYDGGYGWICADYVG